MAAGKSRSRRRQTCWLGSGGNVRQVLNHFLGILSLPGTRLTTAFSNRQRSINSGSWVTDRKIHRTTAHTVRAQRRAVKIANMAFAKCAISLKGIMSKDIWNYAYISDANYSRLIVCRGAVSLQRIKLLNVGAMVTTSQMCYLHLNWPGERGGHSQEFLSRGRSKTHHTLFTTAQTVNCPILGRAWVLTTSVVTHQICENLTDHPGQG